MVTNLVEDGRVSNIDSQKNNVIVKLQLMFSMDLCENCVHPFLQGGTEMVESGMARVSW